MVSDQEYKRWWNSSELDLPQELIADQRMLEEFRLMMLIVQKQPETNLAVEKLQRAASLLEMAAVNGDWGEKTNQIWETVALIHESIGVVEPTRRNYEWLLSALSWQIARMPSIGASLASQIISSTKDPIEKIIASFSQRNFNILELVSSETYRLATLSDQRFQEENNWEEAISAGLLYSLSSYMTQLTRYINFQEQEILPSKEHLDAFLELARNSGATRYYRIGKLLSSATLQFISTSSRLQIDQLNTLTPATRSRLHIYLKKYPELWPSQQDAIAKGLLDQNKKHFVVSVPTSSGKTLCGEVAIIQHLTDHPDSVCFYVVPTRALVSEKSLDLDEKFRDFGYKVAGATSALQRDHELEDSVLQDAKVIVCTPEKLDLLIRHDDSCLSSASLFIIDETHLISDGDRGLGLEFVVIKILILKPNARVILLSAMLPNSEQFGKWLASDAVVSSLGWRPTRQRYGEIKFDRNIPRGSCLKVVTYDSAGKYDGIEIKLKDYSRKPTSILEKVIWAVEVFRAKGPVLVFCMSKSRCEEVTDGIVQYLKDIRQKPTYSSDKVVHLRNKIKREIADDFLLEKSLAYGIAYHHADLPPRIRIDLENLIASNQVQVVICTTTLAEGVNLPISSVIFEDWMTRGDARKGQKPEPLDLSKFLNIAGRAGRAGKENEGIILFLDPEHKPVVINDENYSPRNYFIRENYPPIESRFLDVIRTYDLPEDKSLDDAWEQGDKIWKPEVKRALRQFSVAVLHALEVLQKDDPKITERVISHSLLAVQDPEKQETAKKWFGTWASFYQRVNVAHKELRPIAMQVGLPLRAVQMLYAKLIGDSEAINTFRTGSSNNWVLNSAQVDTSTSFVASIEELDWEPTQVQHGKLLSEWLNGASMVRLKNIYAGGVEEKNRLLERTCNYTTQQLSNSGSWGMYAFVRILNLILGENDVAPITNRLPLMAYFGVNSVPATVLALVGVERIDAIRLGNSYLESKSVDFSITAIREWAKSQGIQSLETIIQGQDKRDLDVETFKILKLI